MMPADVQKPMIFELQEPVNFGTSGVTEVLSEMGIDVDWGMGYAPKTDQSDFDNGLDNLCTGIELIVALGVFYLVLKGAAWLGSSGYTPFDFIDEVIGDQEGMANARKDTQKTVPQPPKDPGRWKAFQAEKIARDEASMRATWDGRTDAAFAKLSSTNDSDNERRLRAEEVKKITDKSMEKYLRQQQADNPDPSNIPGGIVLTKDQERRYKSIMDMFLGKRKTGDDYDLP